MTLMTLEHEMLFISCWVTYSSKQALHAIWYDLPQISKDMGKKFRKYPNWEKSSNWEITCMKIKKKSLLKFGKMSFFVESWFDD